MVNLIENKSKFLLNICSRALTADFHTLDDKKIAKISASMKKIDRATRSFGKKNSQTTSKLMTMTMLQVADSPFRLMRQCCSQIESKRNALKENLYTSAKNRCELEMYQKKKDLTDLDKIEIQKIEMDIADSVLYVEGALKEIAIFQDTYEQVRKANKIREDWDEKDFEEAEIATHIKGAFRNAVRDHLVHGRIGMGTCEYMEQFGINPFTACGLVRGYLEKCEKKGNPDFDDLMIFLNAVADKFKDSYKSVLKHLGINNLLSEDFLYLEK